MMKKPLSITVLGKTGPVKGKDFENLMQIILRQLNYEKFQSPVHSTGMEFDIMTKNKQTGDSYLCECKAQEDKIDTGDLLKFYGKLCHQRSSNPGLRGMFFSTSGFNGTAMQNYSELNNSDREIFKIYDNEDILSLLHDAQIFSSEEEIEAAVKSKTEIELGDRYLVFFKSNLYVVQLLKLGGINHNYIILTGNGELVDKTIRKEISELDSSISVLNEIDLVIIEKILINLLDNELKTVEEIALKIEEKVEDVKVGINELMIQKMVTSNGIEQKIKLSGNIETLGKIIMKLGDKKYEMISTQYLSFMVGRELFLAFTKRFTILMTSDFYRELVSICKLFPSVIEKILFGYSLDYQNPHHQILNSSVSNDKKIKQFEEMNKQLISRFKEGILEVVIKDIEKFNYIKRIGIRAYTTNSSLKIASANAKIVDLSSTSTFYLAIAGGTIKPGEYVTGDDYAILDMAIACMNLEQYERAMRYFDMIINTTTNEFYSSISSYNKGICLMRMTKFDLAIEVFEGLKAKVKPITFIEGHINICKQKLGEELEEIETQLKDLRFKKNKVIDILKKYTN